MRARSGQVGMIRLSKPPQLQPMPNSRMPSSILATARCVDRLRARRRTVRTRSGNRASTARARDRPAAPDRALRALPDVARSHVAISSALASCRCKPDAERAQAAQAEEAIVGRRRDAHVGPQSMQRGKRRGVRDDRAEQHVRVPADVFGHGMHRNVDAVLECAKAERRRPRVVEHDRDAARMRRRRDRRNVLHLERQRARRFGEHQRRVRPERVRDGGSGERIVVVDVDAEAAQVVVAEAARRAVHGVGHSR